MISERDIIRILTGHGIRIRPNALQTVAKQYLAVCQNDDECERLIEKWSKFEILDLKVLEDVQPHQLSSPNTSCEIFIIDVFSPSQKANYDPSTRSFHKSRDSGSYLNSVQGQLSMYRERFLIALDRILLYDKIDFKSRVNTIDSLIGCSSQKIILGILSKNDKNEWVLEDLTSSIRLLISDVERTLGFYCEGFVILAEGRNVDGIFHVYSISHPPLSWICDENFVHPEERWTIPWAEHSCVITLANIHLDEPQVFEMLDKLFLGYSEFMIVLFILIGNFSSQKEPDAYRYPEMFENLVNLICKYEKLQSSAMWVFVPGPNDPGFGGFLPRQKIPLFFMESIQNLAKWQNVSNPCKISFCGKKLVIGRCEQLRKMQRNSVCDPFYECEEEPELHLAETLIKQGHIYPGIGGEIKVLPDFDYALRIDTKIDFLCVAETGKGFKYELEGGVVVYNPGHFSRYSSFFAMTGKDLTGELFNLSLV